MKKLLFLLLLLPLLAGCTIDLPGNEPIPVPAPVEPVNPVNKAPVALYSISHRIPYTEQAAFLMARTRVTMTDGFKSGVGTSVRRGSKLARP